MLFRSISMAGVMVGVMALVIVLSVMAGFQEDLRSKILGTTSHVIIMKFGEGIEDAGSVVRKVKTVPHVLAASPFIYNQIMLTSPKPGEEVKGTIVLIGTVNIPNFGFYKYEVAPLGSDTWATISAGREIVLNSKLGDWITTALTPGDYQLRLVVTDNQGQALPACVVPVRVVPLQ